MSIQDDLIGFSQEDYGEDYQKHVLEIYKLYVEMADRVSGRRQSANSFFLSINTAIIALVGYLQLGNNAEAGFSLFWLVAPAGMILCYLWYRLVRSYRDLNSEKFKVIHEITPVQNRFKKLVAKVLRCDHGDSVKQNNRDSHIGGQDHGTHSKYV